MAIKKKPITTTDNDPVINVESFDAFTSGATAAVVTKSASVAEKKETMISLRIDVDLLNDIKTYAKRHGMTVSGVLKFGASKLIER